MTDGRMGRFLVKRPDTRKAETWIAGAGLAQSGHYEVARKQGLVRPLTVTE